MPKKQGDADPDFKKTEFFEKASRFIGRANSQNSTLKIIF